MAKPITLKIIHYLVVVSLAFSSAATANTLEITYGGWVNGKFGAVGSLYPQYDALLFKDRSDLKLWFEDDLSYEQNAYYKVWQDVTFNDPLATDRMTVSLLGTAFDTGDLNLDGGYARYLRISDMTLNQVDLDSYSVKLIFWGDDNSLTLNDSTMDLRYVDLDPQANAPMHLAVDTGTNKITAWSGNISPSLFTLDVASGASLELFISGSLSTTIPSQRLNFNTPIEGTIDGELFLQNSNVYMNSTKNLEFANGSTLRLGGIQTFLEVEHIAFDGSTIDLGRYTTFQVNQEIKLTDTTLSFDDNSALITDGIISTLGNVTLDGSGPNSGIRGTGLLRLNNLGGSTQFSQQNITESRVDYLLIGGTSSMNLENTVFTVNTQIYANDDASINLTDATFVLNGYTGGNDSDFDLTIDNSSRFRVNRRGTWYQNPNSTIDNDGSIFIEGDYFANGTIDGSGLILIREDGVMDFGFNDHQVYTLTTDNRIIFEPDLLNLLPSADGGTLNMRLGVTGGNASNDTIQYGAGDITLTQMRALNVGLTQAFTADELDGQSFTLIQAQNSGVAGTLVGAASAPLVEGADIPALIDFTITDANTNGKPDLTLNAQKQGNNALLTHPSVRTENQQGASQLIVNAANSGNTAINNALNQLTNGQVASDFDSIHAEPYSSYITVSLEHSDMVMNTVQNRAVWGGVFSSGGSTETTQPETLRRTWMEGVYVEGDVDGDNNLGDFDYTLTGLTIGQDLLVAEDSSLGVYVSFGTQKMDEHDRAMQDFDSDMYHLGLYLNQKDIGGWDLRGVLGYGYGDHDSTRWVTLADSSTVSSADFNSHSFYGGLKGTITAYKNDWITLAPELGLNYIYYEQESFKESGDPDLSLKVDSADAQSIIASAGLNARFASLSETFSIYPVAFVRYEHDVYANDNNEHEVDAALLSHQDYKETFVGQNRGEHAIITGLGLGSELTSALQIKGGLIYVVDSDGSEWGGGFNLEYLW